MYNISIMKLLDGALYRQNRYIVTHHSLRYFLFTQQFSFHVSIYFYWNFYNFLQLTMCKYIHLYICKCNMCAYSVVPLKTQHTIVIIVFTLNYGLFGLINCSNCVCFVVVVYTVNRLLF